MKASFQCKRCEKELEIEIDVSPYIPAFTGGAPENCYPAEGGEITVVETIICDGDLLDEDDNVIGKCGALYEELCDLPSTFSDDIWRSE